MYSLNKTIVFLVLIFTGITLLSCANNNSDQNRDYIKHSKQFVIYDESLNERIKINNIAKRSAGDLLTGMVEIQNIWFGELKVEYRYAWYDAEGFELDPQSRSWQALVMPTNARETLKTTAPSAAATDFKIFIKER